MAGIDTSIYANQQRPDPIGNLGQTVGLANAFTQNQVLNTENQMLRAQYGANQAIGQAYSGAIGPNGVYDPAAANLAIQGNPTAAYGAPEAIQRNVGIQGGQISNAASLASSRQDQLSQAIGDANSQPTRAGMVQVLSQRLWSGKLSSADYNSLISSLPPDDAGAKAYMSTRAAGTIPTPSQASPVQAGVNSDLTPKMVPLAKAASMAQQPGGYAGSAPPGASEVSAADRKTLFEDQLRGSGILSNMRPLQQALPLIQRLSNANFGPGSPQWATLKGALTTAGVINPNTSDLQVRQEANKYLLKYATGAQAAGRSDHALSAALGSNPNLDLTQPANLGLIKTQIGMDRMDAAMPKAFPTQAKPGQTYSDFKSSYYQGMDPRAFSFDMMSPQERAKLKASLGPSTSPAYQKFVKSYDIAKQTGMLQPQGSTP